MAIIRDEISHNRIREIALKVTDHEGTEIRAKSPARFPAVSIS